MARPRGQTSNFLLDELVDWNARLERCFQAPLAKKAGLQFNHEGV